MRFMVIGSPVPPRIPASAWRRLLRGLTWAFFGIAVPFVLLPSALLAAVAETLPGRLAGLIVVTAFAIPPAVFYARVSKASRRRRLIPVAAFVVLLPVLAAWLLAWAPSGEHLDGAPVRSVHPGPAEHRRYSPANLVPEIDQIKLGCRLIPFLDPLIDRAQARRLEEVTLRIYREAEARPEYREMGSALGHAYAEMFGASPDSGHLYQYVPPHRRGDRLPAILFLHGSVGNFKAYLRVWEGFAAPRGFVVVCPTFGFGNWDREGGAEAVERARAYALAQLPVDPDRIWLAGLSNGGLGVCRAAAANPRAYAGLILITPVLHEAALRSSEFAAGWTDRPILVLSGVQDNRIPRSYIEAGVARLSAAGARVTHHPYAGEDHFLFFSSREKALEDIANWIDSQTAQKKKP